MPGKGTPRGASPSMVVFILNPISGVNRRPEKIRRAIQDIWGPSGRRFEIWQTEGRGHATELASRAVEQGADMVVAIGGDGTINEVGRGLVGSQTALGVIPAGSGNGFARNFDIPLDQPQAIRMLLAPAIRTIDVGQINQHYFFNVAGLGLDAQVAARFDRFGIRGPLPYFLVGAREFLRYTPQPIALSNEKEQRTIHPLVFSIANLPQYGNGAVIAPDARPDDGQLDVCILYPISIVTALTQVYRLFNGTIQQVREYETFRIRSLKVERPRADYIHTDGDPHWADRVLDIQVLPRQLRVAVPPDPHPATAS
ncbi:MAG: diacylglycerol kinase family lipid kinase [Calditrichaeota bacterium]|nr:MAG: diacylglycerol kinase family lipid kinase [Calditrichota bacterium]